MVINKFHEASFNNIEITLVNAGFPCKVLKFYDYDKYVHGVAIECE